MHSSNSPSPPPSSPTYYPMAPEDFTFPIVSDAFPPRFLDSPPLWRVSSAPTIASNASRRQEEDNEEGGCSASKPKPVDHSREDEDDDDNENRMDMLWEDFNEELHHKYCNSMSGSQEKVGCVPGGAVVAARRAASLLMFMKMLRKLFQLHHSPHPSHKAHPL